MMTRIGSRVPVPKRMGEFGSSVHRSGGSICSGGGETRCSAVWSAHLFWVQRAIGSNPVTLMWYSQGPKCKAPQPIRGQEGRRTAHTIKEISIFFQSNFQVDEIGRVVSVGDGVAHDINHSRRRERFEMGSKERRSFFQLQNSPGRASSLNNYK